MLALDAALAEAARHCPDRARVTVGGGGARVAAILAANGFAPEPCGEGWVGAKVPCSLRLRRHAGLPWPGRSYGDQPRYAPYAALGEGGSLMAGWRRLLARGPVDAAPRTACVVVWRVATGGAERQACLLAAALAEAGWKVRVLSVYPPEENARHYTQVLERAGVALSWLPHPDRAAGEIADWAAGRAGRDELAALTRLPPALTHATLATWRELEADRPALLLGFLDGGSLQAGMAGSMAGIPAMVLAGRSLHPGMFPEAYHDTSEVMGTIYRLLARSPRIRMLNNSLAGARSYEGWLGLPAGTIGLLPNIVAPPPPVSRSLARRELGIALDAPVVLGAFRLGPEKRPLLFAETVALLARDFPGLVAMVAGDGVLRPELEAALSKLGLAGTVRLLGVRQDMERLFAAADMVLHVARVEGMPNILLEAQAHGRPVVAARVGGTAEAVAPCLHPMLVEEPSAAELAGRGARLLGDPATARRLGEEARRHVLARHTAEAGRRAVLDGINFLESVGR